MNTERDPICLMVSIVDRARGKFVKRFCEENGVLYSFRLHGEGTAGSDLLALLGLFGSEKNLIYSLVPQSRSPELLRAVSRLMNMGSPGRGIVFTIPLNAINALAHREIHRLLPPPGDEAPRKENNLVEFRLLLAVYAAGFTDELVACARAAGATGGTVVHARGIAKERGETLFGLTVADEKEVLLILTPADHAKEILEALNRDCGPKTGAQAMIFSLPVDDVAGI